MLERHGMGFPDARVSISGSGNVAQYAAVKSMELGARVVTLSDSEGTLVVEQGLSDAQLAALMAWKNEQRGRLSVFSTRHKLQFLTGQRPWGVPPAPTLPCRPQSEPHKPAAPTTLPTTLTTIRSR